MNKLTTLNLMILATAGFTTTLNAAPISGGTATYQFFNSFFSTFPPVLEDGSPNPFYPAPTGAGDPNAPDISVPIAYVGTLTEVWQDQVGSTIDFEVTDIFADGELPDGTPFQILGGASAAQFNLDPFPGEFTNVVQDPTAPGFASGDPSSLQSALRSASGPFAQVLFPGPNQIVFYGSEPYRFENEISSLPYRLGQEILGTADSRIPIRLLTTSSPDPNLDPIVAYAEPNGFVQIVPEPSSALVASLAVAFLGITLRSRKNK